MLNATQILSVDDRKIETLEIKEWGGEVGVRVMAGDERDEYESMILNKSDAKGRLLNSKQIRVALLVNVLCNDKGEKLFDDKQMKELNKKSGMVLDKVFNEALRINGMDKDAEKRIEKN